MQYNHALLSTNFQIMAAKYEGQVATGNGNFYEMLNECNLLQAYNFWQFLRANRVIVSEYRILDDTIRDLEQRLLYEQAIDPQLRELVSQFILQANIQRAMEPVVFQYNQLPPEMTPAIKASHSMRKRG